MTNETMARTIGHEGRGTVQTMIALLLAATLMAAGLAVVSTATASAQDDPVKVGVMFTQLAGDKGPVDDMIAFLDKAEEDLGVKVTWVEAPDAATYEQILRNLALEGKTIKAIEAYHKFLETYQPQADGKGCSYLVAPALISEADFIARMEMERAEKPRHKPRHSRG
jgi:ABC-type glycerol-3-phosphate transport system substrate-binding protein